MKEESKMFLRSLSLIVFITSLLLLILLVVAEFL